MQINFIYDSSVNFAPAGFKPALAAAAQYLGGLITNAITINIQVGWGENNGSAITGGIATGGPSAGIVESYAQLTNNLAANARSTSDDTAIANLPVSDPTFGGNFFISSAQEKAWGLIGANAGGIDGSIGFGTGVPFNFDPVNRGISGEYDFVGVAEHEITHAMGRLAGLQTDFVNRYTPLDLYRYAAPGTFQFIGGRASYFSIDGGRTNLNPFDTAADFGDWASSVRNDSFGYASFGAVNLVTASDMVVMDALGFAISTATPSPQPVVTQVSASPGAGYVGTGQTVTLTLSMSKAVTIAGGTPSLALNDGGVATYVSGSGTSALIFSYTVLAGQNTPNLVVTAVNLNGATIAGTTGQAANLSLASLTQHGPFIATPPSSPSVITLAANASFTASQPNLTVLGGGGTTSVSVQSAGAVFLGDTGNDLVTLASTNATIVGASGNATVNAVAGSAQVFAGTGATRLNQGTAAVTLQGGTGALTVNATASGSAMVFGGTSPMFFSGGTAAATVVGGVSSGVGADTIFANGGGEFYGGSAAMLFIGGPRVSTVIGGVGNSTLFGGSSGRDLLVAGLGPTTLVGANGNTLVGLGTNTDVLIAGPGNETLVGSGGGGSDIMFANNGNVAMFAGIGNDTFVASSGTAQMFAGAGTNLFIFVRGAVGGSDTIWNFNQGQDHVALFGYGTGIVPNLLNSAVVTSSGTTITLADNTRLTFQNLTHVTTNDIFAG